MINKNSKVLSISHNDLDGVGCQILLANYFHNISYYNWGYYEIDEKFQNIDFNAFDYVIVSDLSPTNHELLKHPKIIYIDHHESAIELSCPKENRFIDITRCGTALVAEWLDKTFDFDYTPFHSFVQLVNDYDMWILKYPFSWDLNCMFQKYKEKLFFERFLDGNMVFNDEENDYVNAQKEVLNNLYNNLDIVELKDINGCFFFAEDFLNDLCHRMMEEKGYKFSFCYNVKRSTISIRTVTNLNIGVLLRKLDVGGGHAKAAGTKQVVGNDVMEMVEKISKGIRDEMVSKMSENG
jgi:oligoribonuclease NrnB/cAMP/cGMP phosphodiesterase (DHH superfamily)